MSAADGVFYFLVGALILGCLAAYFSGKKSKGSKASSPLQSGVAMATSMASHAAAAVIGDGPSAVLVRGVATNPKFRPSDLDDIQIEQHKLPYAYLWK